MHNTSIKTERIKGLKNGKGIQYLLNEAYEILGNPILLHDMEYKVIDYNRNIVTDDPIWNEYVEKGTVSHSWLDFFKLECFLDAAANTKSITFLTSNKLKYNRIYGKIFNKNKIQIGCACMVACDKLIEDNDALLFEEICAIISKELGRDKFYNDYGQAYLEKLIEELINGISDKELYTAHVESIYMHLKTNLYLSIIDIGGIDPQYTQLAYFRDLLRKTQPEYTYAIYSNYILIIIDTDDSALNVKKDLNRLNKFLQKNNIHAGISSCFDNLFALQKYFKEALEALNNGPDTTDQHIFLYDQIKCNAGD